MLKLFSLLVKTSPAPPPPEEATQGVTNWLCRTVGKFGLKETVALFASQHKCRLPKSVSFQNPTDFSVTNSEKDVTIHISIFEASHTKQPNESSHLGSHFNFLQTPSWCF